jgi:alkylhydroperoxidase family enzyme
VPRIPYVPPDITEPADTVGPIRERRGGELLELDRMLLHSPPFARGWNALLREVRGELSLPPRLRELVICAIAALNGADYEMEQHAPVFLAEGGTEAELQALRGIDRPEWNPPALREEDLAVLRFVVQVIRDVRPTDDAFAAARDVLENDRQIVELVGLIGTYSMVSRFLVALGVGE